MTTDRDAKREQRPVVALAMGDAAGISPELTARLLALPEARAAARIVVFGDARILRAGAATAAVRCDLPVAAQGAVASDGADAVLVDLHHCDPSTIRIGEVSRESGAFSAANFRAALEFARDGHAQAVCYTPLNKAAMRAAHPGYEDEIGFLRDVLGRLGPASEFNVLGALWNARVTSHVALREVADLLAVEPIVQALVLTRDALLDAAIDPPRIAVAALNPHAGDHGNFGREEIDIIAPAVEAARARGIDARGPFPADTVYLKARAGEFDAVLTMYHDQGQIAMKLMGFERGVTLLGGAPFPVTTPAHGTAHDIAGKGVANVGATREAFLLAARMAERRRDAAGAVRRASR